MGRLPRGTRFAARRLLPGPAGAGTGHHPDRGAEEGPLGGRPRLREGEDALDRQRAIRGPPPRQPVSEVNMTKTKPPLAKGRILQ